MVNARQRKQWRYHLFTAFVLLALIVIMLPFFQENKDFALEIPFLKAPPFPDQPVQVAVTPLNGQQAWIQHDMSLPLHSNVAWVVDAGSFKNKINALRLANQLRVNGYRAFIQQTPSAFGSNTQVFIGPESQQASALLVANELKNKLHVRGIVENYRRAP